MRASFHCAIAWPFSAANSSALIPSFTSPARSAKVPLRKASAGVRLRSPGGVRLRLSGAGPGIGAARVGTAMAGGVAGASAGAVTTVCGGTASTPTAGPTPSRAGVPSNPKADTRPSPTVNSATVMTCSDIRIGPGLCSRARMCHGAVARRADLLGVFPQIAGRELGLSRLPALPALVELGLAQRDVEDALLGVDLDDVAVADEPDRAAGRRLRPDMADAQPAGRTGKPSVGDERDLAAHALAIERRGGGEHLTHARAALGALVADDQHVALFELAHLYGRETRLLAVKTARRAGELELLQTGHFHNRTVRGEISLQTHHAAGREQRLVSGTDHVLVLVPFHPLEVLGHGAAGHRHAVAVHEAVLKQRLHQQRHPTSFEQVFGDITTARFQIRDIWCPFEDGGDVEQVELDPAFVGDRRQVQRAIG